MPHLPNLLLVEGQDEIFSIANLMKNYIEWTKDVVPVHIDKAGSVDELLNIRFIKTNLKIAHVSTIGLIVDADTSCNSRWESLRNTLKSILTQEELSIPNELNLDLPSDGLIIENIMGKRLGVWVMPDNQSLGMLETFLAYLIPDDNHTLWKYAQDVTVEAKERGAPYIVAHTDKSKIHTWLAWQSTTGIPFGTAIHAKILDPNHPKAETFVNWFRRLYQL